MWTDALGRTYEYSPHRPTLLAEADIGSSSGVTLALAEASRALEALPKVPMAGVATAPCRSSRSASSLIESVRPRPRRVLEVDDQS